MKSLLFALLAAMPLVTANAAYAQLQNIEKPNLELAVGGRALLGYLPLTIAERKGFFEKEGLSVNISDFQGGSKSLQAVVAGSAHIASGAYEHTILSAVKGIELKAIALQNNSFGVVIALPAEEAADYKGPESLKGKRIGVTAPGSSSAVAVSVLLAKAGLSDQDVSIVGVGGGAGAVAAMESGQVNAISNYDPVISILESKGEATPIVDTRNEEGLRYLYGGAFAGSAFYATAQFVKDNPNTVQAFANAIVGALQWMQSASTDEIVDAVPEEYYGGDKAMYRTMIEKNRGMFSKDGRISEEAAENVLHAISTSNPDVAGAKIDLVQTYDNSFVEAALK